MPRTPDAVIRGGHDDDDDDISSHGSMPSLEPLVTAPTAGLRKKHDTDNGTNDEEDGDDDLSMPSLEEIRPDRTSQQQGRTSTGTVGGTSSRDEQADDLFGMIARVIADELLKKDDTDGSDDGDDDDDSSSMPPLEDIAADEKSRGDKRGRDGTDIKKSKTEKPPASVPFFSTAQSGQKTTNTATTGTAPFKFNLGTSGATGSSSNPSPFTFAAGPLASSASTTKNKNDDAPRPFTFSTGPSSRSKKAGVADTTNKKNDDSRSSTFVFSPTSVATPSASAASSPPSSGKNLAFHFNAASGTTSSSGSAGAGAPSPNPFFSTPSKDPSLQAAAKAAKSSASSVSSAPANSIASSIFGPAPAGPAVASGGASDRRRKKKRDATGNKARTGSSPPLSPQLGAKFSPPIPLQFGPAAVKAQSTTLKTAKDGDMEKKPAAVPPALAQARNASATATRERYQRELATWEIAQRSEKSTPSAFAQTRNASAEAAIERAAERAADDILSTGRSTSVAVASAMTAEGVAMTGDADDESKKPSASINGDILTKLPPAPKRNQTAFFIYSVEKRAEVRAENPGATYGDIAKIISTQFKSLSAEDRAKYDQLAERDKERYQREMAAWEMTRRSAKSTPSTTLFVANFNPRHTSDDDLKELIQRHGNICYMVVKKNIAFVTFTSVAEAENVRGTLDGVVVDGHCISVSFAVGQRPAGSKSPMQIYKEEHRDAMKMQNPGWSDLQIDGSLQGQYFCRLTNDERVRYDKLSDEDDGRYDREMASWESENRKYTTVNYVEPPTGSCNCENCGRAGSNTFRSLTFPKGDAFTFVNGSPSPIFQNNGAPRRIVRGRRPPNTSAASPSANINTASVTAGNATTPSNTAATGSHISVTSRIAPTATATGTDTAAPAPASPPTSLTAAIPTERASASTERSPRADSQADGTNENITSSTSNREVSDDADSESDDEVTVAVDQNANAFGALAEDSEENDEDDNAEDSEETSLPSSNGDDEEDDDDDDDDDDDSEDFPLRLLEDLLPPGVGSRVAARLMNGGGPGNRQQLSTNIKPDDDDSFASSDDEGGLEAAKCCACYRSGNQNHKWKRLVTLPCCGLGGKEKSSSTRFCASCVLKLAVTRPESASSLGEYHFFEDERNEAPASRFYKENRQSETKRFIECPRCRDILIVKLKNLKTSYSLDGEDEDSDSSECDCSECRAERRANRQPTEVKTASSISVHRATFKAKAWFIGRKRDNAMILWKAAHLHHRLIPLTALGGDKYRANVMKLVGWGILRKVPGKRNVDIYEMDRRDQVELVKLVSPNPTTETDEEINKEFDLFLDLTHDMGYAGWDAIKKFRIDRAIRLLNRFLYLMMYFRRYLPSPPLSLWQEWAVTALNAFNLALVIQFLLITAVYGGLFFGVSIAVCRALRNPEKFRSASRWMYLSAFLGAYLAYRFGKLLYFSPYITFWGFLSPKAIIPFKKILWG